ncbi:1,2-dihydroxy-3-keto-5-methylthiopentene dioxygenase [Lysobacter sp. HA35]
MSRLRIFHEATPDKPEFVSSELEPIREHLAPIGVGFERWEANQPIKAGDAPDVILDAYRSDIDRIVRERNFKTVDVVSIAPDNPNHGEARKKFLDEHFHKEDEVRFFVAGSGLFTLHASERVYEMKCEAGDLISVPDSMLHWFDMGPEPNFVAIRFFQEPDGWIGHFTGNDIAQKFPRYEPGQAG